ncbi:uncharacterized protein CMU_005260 [Cryptosporidium muris RN66]|uniref:PH domain-containing protein n=1 Tax=Cryptosporidium muris (strain RN66) TaxID=441375 RepID=B6AHA8_CRYMR|nr:uncharacterized protein CMU_005260 [Cryptosporidium muris RN66]EEA07603.1 hypothetical protein, conserved [Cryptosporidium muris RN66]|eukprot:XP_002141952.1 hypothetical protein [Cryptosporidium muris RN66]
MHTTDEILESSANSEERTNYNENAKYKQLEQKIQRLEKLVKSRDEALNEMYELEKQKNEEIGNLKIRLRNESNEVAKYQTMEEQYKIEIIRLQSGINELEHKSTMLHKLQVDSSSPKRVEEVLTEHESLYQEIANLRLQISQQEDTIILKNKELSEINEKILDINNLLDNLYNNSKFLGKNNEVDSDIFKCLPSEFSNMNNKNLQINKNETNKIINRVEDYFNKLKIMDEYLQNKLEDIKCDLLKILRFTLAIIIDENTLDEDIEKIKEKILEYLNLTKFSNDIIIKDNNLINKDEKLIYNNFLNKIKEIKNKNVNINNNNDIAHKIIEIIEDKSVLILQPLPPTPSLDDERNFILKCIESEYQCLCSYLNYIIEGDDNIRLFLIKGMMESIFQKVDKKLDKSISYDNNKDSLNINELRINKNLKLIEDLIIRLFCYILNDNIEEFLNILKNINNGIYNIEEYKDINIFEDNSSNIKMDIVNILELLTKETIFILLEYPLLFGWTGIHILVYRNQIDILHYLININQEEISYVVNWRSMSGFTPLMLAVTKGDILLISLLLENGADVNNIDNRKNTLLHISEDKDIQQILIEHFIEISLQNSSGQLPKIVLNNLSLIDKNIDNISNNIDINRHNIINTSDNTNYDEDISLPETPLLSYRKFDSTLKSDDLDMIGIESNCNKVNLTTIFNGIELESTCKDDFCVFSTQEELNEDNNTEKSGWNVFGFVTGNNSINNIYDYKCSDHAAMEQNPEKLEELGLTIYEKKNKLWSDIVINFTSRGLESSCFPPPLDCSSIFRQILVLTSERIALYQHTPLKLLQAAPIIDVEELAIPQASNVLLLLKIDGWDDILLEIRRRDEFLEEFTTIYRTITTPSDILLSQATNINNDNELSDNEEYNNSWFSFIIGSRNNKKIDEKTKNLSPARVNALKNLIAVYGENPPISKEKDNLIGLFNSINQYALVLALINNNKFMLLPHRSTSLLVSIPTYHFGFLNICLNPSKVLINPLYKDIDEEISSNNKDQFWKERFFMLRSDGYLLWTQHPNDTVANATIPIRLIRQIRVFNLIPKVQDDILPCFALDFTHGSSPASLILYSDDINGRDIWVERIHNVRTIISNDN